MLAHNVTLLADALPQENAPHVTVFQLVSIDPLPSDIDHDQLLRSSCNVHPPRILKKFIELASVTVFIVIVFPVAKEQKFIVPVYVRVIPLTKETLPNMLRAALPASVGAPTNGFPHVMSAQFAFASIVTV